MIFLIHQSSYEMMMKLLKARIHCPEVFCKKGVLGNFGKFKGKHLCQGLFLNKVAGLRPATLLKKRLWHRRFPVNFPKFLRTPVYIEHLWWPRACNFIKKETLAQVFSCEFSKISKNTFLHRTPQVAASVFFRSISRNAVSGTFHETNTFMKDFTLVSKFHCVCFSSIKSCVYGEKTSSDCRNLIALTLINNISYS